MWLYVLNCNTCFSCLDQQSPGREFLLRVSYLEIYNEVYYLNKFECCTIFINFFNACIWSYFIWLLNRVLVWFTLWFYLDWLGPSQKGSCLIILLGMHLHFIYSYTFFLKFLLATIFLVMQNLYFPEVVAPIYTCLFYGHIRLLSLIFLSWRSKQNLMSFSMLRLSIFLYYMDRFNQYISLQVINDLLDPTGQNLRVREDAQV